MPPGATRFAPDKWRRQVAYAPQFADPDSRAHIGQAKIKSRLIADLDPDDGTCRLNQNGCVGAHDRCVKRYDVYEATLDYGLCELAAKFLSN
jgi:hypothetical protein